MALSPVSPAVPGFGPGNLATTRFTPAFYRLHLLLPLGAMLLAIAVALAGVDQWLADAIYRWEGMQWALKDHYLTSHVIHRIGKKLSTLLWLAALAGLLVARFNKRHRDWLRPLAYLCVAVLASVVCVSVLKSLTHMDCPWDLIRYGGSHPFVGLFEPRPAGLRASACFPAGHASGGYAWVALYFLLWSVRPRWRWAGLAFGLGLGLTFGISQQLRGAHFLSHDIATLILCWVVALCLHWLMLRNYPMPGSTRPISAPDGVSP